MGNVDEAMRIIQAGAKERAFESRPSLDVADAVVRADMVRRLRDRWTTIDKLAKAVRCIPAAIEEALQHLAASGYLIHRDGPRVRIEDQPRVSQLSDAHPIKAGTERTIGVISDSHLCSTYQRLDVLEAAYTEFKRQGIADVYHAGNIVDGHAPFNRFELLAHGVTDQAHYLLDHYPRRPGITTHYITGCCHEGWWMAREGMEFGRYLQYEAADRGRNDLDYLGYGEADIRLPVGGRSSMMRLAHPGGGTAYALSYAPQKIVESLQGGEKPAILLIGHYHKAEFLPNLRNVYTLQAGCTQDQTRWMRGKHIDAHVGFWVVRFAQDGLAAVRRFRAEWFGWYDRTYHAKEN